MQGKADPTLHLSELQNAMRRGGARVRGCEGACEGALSVHKILEMRDMDR